MSKEFSDLVGEALGRASMAWSETPSGIFDSDTCCVLHIDIMNAHNVKIKTLQDENAYKQKEIDELKNVTYWTVEQDNKVTRHISIAKIEKLQAENAKLKAILMVASEASCYTEYEDACSLVRQVLKELEEK